ncbi:MAG TPA: hypothetical protein VHD63_25380 [Ktedonobacteraceae bacterium]|nr:hypothetical protein [Ktedonobacteraceae bacterium]
MAKLFSRIQRPSLRWGLIFGIILGLANIAYNVAVTYVTDVNAQQILGYIPAILFLVLGFYAGMRAAQETGKWTSGLAAGVWVGVISVLVVEIVVVVNTIVNLQNIIATQRQYIQMNQAQFGDMKPSDFTASDVAVTVVVEALISIITASLFTTIGGALGGFTGRRRALAVAQSQPYTESLFEEPAADGAASDETPAATSDEVDSSAEPAEIKDEATK